MSQRSVEQVIGRLATDEELRDRFTTDPATTLERLVAAGVELNPCERAALAALDPRAVRRFARTLDPRIQKSALHWEGCR